MSINKEELKLAVLIDAENVPFSNIKGILEEIVKYGTPTIKRIYADWTKPTVSGWKNSLLENAIIPIQQYSYTSGKNSTDSALIIDAMDILYSAKVDGFCIISSDSDFTRLATRLREAGMKVFGFGERKTPTPFIVACDRFTYIEVINSNTEQTREIKLNVKNNNLDRINKNIINLISSSINDISSEDGWANLGEVGSHIQRKRPDFDPRNYGFGKLSLLIRSLNEFEIQERKNDKSNNKSIYIRSTVKTMNVAQRRQ
jgi:uncharacterized LabA/DUF88 family protein/Fe-S-cluster formation regulator IscX/YfhJ